MQDPASTAGKTLAVEEQTELLIVGAGPAGLATAIEAARLGLKVVLVDENPVPAETMAEDIPLMFGGRMSGAVRNRSAMIDAIIASDPAIAEAFDAGVDVRLGTLCWGIYDNGPAVGWLPGPVAGLADADRSWMIAASEIIICTGRRDMGLAFPGWDLIGVMGMVAAQTLADRYGALDVRSAVVLGSASEALQGARRLHDAGVHIAAIVELAPTPIDPTAADSGFELLCGHVVRRAEGNDGVQKLIVAPRDKPNSEREIQCDAVVLSIGLVPVVELLDAAGCRIVFSTQRGGHVPVLDAGERTTLPHVLAAGDCAGIWPAKCGDPEIARNEGRRAARSVAAALGRLVTDSSPPPAPNGVDQSAYRLDWVKACVIDATAAPYVCRCEEVTAYEILEVRPPRYLAWTDQRNRRDLSSLLGEAATNPDLVKRLTRAGMGVCQGRRCREQVACLLALGANADLSSVPLASYRAPVRPMPLRLAAQPESLDMTAHWDTWFGMAAQYVPFWDAPRHYLARERPVRGKAASE